MKINDIYESTTAGSVATVAMPMTGGIQSRSKTGTGVYSTKKVGNLTDKKPGKYANSIRESKDIKEAHLDEEELIIVPGQGHKLKSGFIPHAEDRRDHEVEMARSDLFQAAKNAKQTFEMLQGVSEDEGVEGWVQAKITKAADYLNSVRQYLEGKQVQGMSEAGSRSFGGISTATSRAKQASMFVHDPDRAATNYKANKYDPETGLGGYVAPHVYNRGYESNIMIQLQKNLKTSKASPLKFEDDSTLTITPKIAQEALNKINAMKPAEKHETVKKLMASKDNFINFVKVKTEGAKVDRMVKHIEKSEEKAGKSKKEAENIAWATANKRGMLDNKNRVKGK